MRPREKTDDVGDLSKAVKLLRGSLGQTQQQFAHTLSTAITTVARWETGRAPKGLFLVRLAEVAAQNKLADLEKIFRDALAQELGTWDTSGFNLALEPKNDAERLHVAAVLAMLRNPQYSRSLPQLRKILSSPPQ